MSELLQTEDAGKMLQKYICRLKVAAGLATLNK
jgi:hypothetical protein